MADILWYIIPTALLVFEIIAYTRRMSAFMDLQQCIDEINPTTDKEKVLIAGTVKPATDILYLLLNVFTVPFVLMFLLITGYANKNIDSIIMAKQTEYDKLTKCLVTCAFRTSFILSLIIGIEIIVIGGFYIALRTNHKPMTTILFNINKLKIT